ncbi:Ste/ste20/mst protein kinase [Globisporangium polare]
MLKSLGLEDIDPEHVFEIQTKEGAGAFGRVFRAYYKSDPSKLAALKVIPVALEAGQRGEDIENVRKEIQFLRECDHPNVVAFYGAYYKDGALWVAMEYCGGGSVGDVSRTRRLEESEIACIMRGALQGLAYLHSKKKIHRDIKGGNILLTTSGQVKIADFGVSAQLRDTMSRRGTFVGTPYWMSPEMIQDSDYDYKSDIWSLGITAIELADQKPPLFDEHPMRVLIQIPRNPSPQLKVPGNWSKGFSHFLGFCLQKDPVERPSALECLEHEFIRGVAHIEQVFARAEAQQQQQPSVVEASFVLAPAAAAAAMEASRADEEESKAASAAAAAASQDLAVAASAVRAAAGSESVGLSKQDGDTEVKELDGGSGGGDDIAENISRLDDDSESGASDSDGSEDNGERRLSSGGELTKSPAAAAGEDDGSSDSDASSTADEVFNFRQPAASAAGVDAQESSASMVSGDELLQLSVSESVELPFELKNKTILSPTAGAPPQICRGHAPAAVHSPPVTTVASQPPTEFKLLPSASASPLRKSKQNHEGGRFSTSSKFSIGSLLDASSDSAASAPHIKSPQQQQRQPSKQQQSVVTTTPKQLSSISSSWQNPLSDVHSQMSPSNARVNVLLSSINSLNSLSSSSTRMFTKLLQEEVEHQKLNQDPHVSINSVTSSSRHATPRLAHQGEDLTHRRSPQCASVSASTRASPIGSTTANHFIGGPFRVAHDVSVKFNSVDARFEGAPASQEWAVLHQQFGLSLAQMRCRSTSASMNGNDHLVPALLHMLRRELLKRDGLTTKFIYRASPEQNELQGVKKAINSGSVDHARVSDPHVYASLLKHWLRDLPSLLLATLSIDDIVGIGKLQRDSATNSNRNERDLIITGGNSEVSLVLGKLPQQERAVLEWLLDHMIEVVDRCAVNKMTAQSLAVVMAPNLFNCESVSKTLQGSSETVNSVAEFLGVLLAWRQKTTTATVRGRGDSLGRSLSFARAPSVGPQGSRELLQSRSFAFKSSHGFASAEFAESSLPGRFEDDVMSQSLEEMVKVTVDNIQIELDAQGIGTVETLLADKLALSELFERYQRSILEMIAWFSKRSEDRDWAANFLVKLGNGFSFDKLAAIPSSLNHMKRWVRAALSVEDFLSLLRSEKTMRDKLDRLRKRFPMAKGTKSTGTLDPEKAHDLFHQISKTDLGKSNAAGGTQKPLEGDVDYSGQDTNDNLLLEGAHRLLRFSADPDNHSELHLCAEEIASCGKTEPLIGKILVGLSQSTRLAHLGLEESQQELVDAVESALQLHQLLQS